jgi:voltage-gated potassium channel
MQKVPAVETFGSYELVVNANDARRDRYSLVLLVSVVLFIVLLPILEQDRVGEMVLITSMFAILIFATLDLSAKRTIIWPAIILAASSMVGMIVSHTFPLRQLIVGNGVALMLFFGFVSARLFLYLSQHGSARSHLIASVSLYLILGIFWFTIYWVVETLQPGSFAQRGGIPAGGVRVSTFLYLSLETLTTLGYGDVLPVSPVARMFATLEAATGVIYIAVTVSRMVGAAIRSK